MSARAAWAKPDADTPDEQDPFAEIDASGPPPEPENGPSSNGNGHMPARVTTSAPHEHEKAAWNHSGRTLHPMPVGYWCEDDYTLETPISTLEGRIVELHHREENAFKKGVACEIKDMPENTCSACPVCEVGKDTRKSALCRLGREQERVMSLITVLRFGDGGHPVGE